MDLNEVLSSIATMSHEDLNRVFVAVKARTSVLRAEATMTAITNFEIGDPVVLQGLSPKYVNGATGNIVGVLGSKFRVKLGDDASNWRARARYGLELSVPASCIRRAGER